MNQFADLSFAIAEPSVRDLILAGSVSLLSLAVFLRMKLG
jgi:hypothetical protein